MTNIIMALLVVGVMVGIFVVRSNTARERKATISRIESDRVGQSMSPVADLFREEGVPMPTSVAATRPPPTDSDTDPAGSADAPTAPLLDDDESVVESGQDA